MQCDIRMYHLPLTHLGQGASIGYDRVRVRVSVSVRVRVRG